MQFSDEKMRQLEDRVVAAKSLEEVESIYKELGDDFSPKDMARFLGKVEGQMEELSDEMLETVSGGVDVDVPQIETIRGYYKEKGPNLAFILCIYYIPSPICYEIIQVIENE